MKKLLLSFFLLLALNKAHAQNVGIGISSPTQKLDVSGNVQFSGALMPGGSAGTVGQTLQSNGLGITPTWGNATQGQQWNTVNSSSSIVLDKLTTTPTLIPGLTQSVTIPPTGIYAVFIYTDGGAQWSSNPLADNNAIQTELSIWIDGAAAKYTTLLIDNPNNFSGGIRYWAFSLNTSLSTGAHTVEVRARVVNWTINSETAVTFAASNTVGNYLISTLSVALIKK